MEIIFGVFGVFFLIVAVGLIVSMDEKQYNKITLVFSAMASLLFAIGLFISISMLESWFGYTVTTTVNLRATDGVCNYTITKDGNMSINNPSRTVYYKATGDCMSLTELKSTQEYKDNLAEAIGINGPAAEQIVKGTK